MLNESNCKANPPPQKDEEEENSGEEEGKEDGEEEPGVSESQKVFKEVRRPVHLLGEHQVKGFSMNPGDQAMNSKMFTCRKFLDTLGSVEEIESASLSPQ